MIHFPILSRKNVTVGNSNQNYQSYCKVVACYFCFAGKRKIHYTFSDGSELVEEYDFTNHRLLGRTLYSFISYYLNVVIVYL